MKLKVCGMRDAENISELIKLNPDYIGFIFYDKSKRHVECFPVVDIPSEIKKVGVFVDEPIENVIALVEENGLDVVQLHGNESPEYIEKLNFKFALKFKLIEVFKAFSVNDEFDFSKTEPYQKNCHYLLFDTKGKNHGGNGVKFNWEVLKKYKGETPFLLSGGISKNDGGKIKQLKHDAFAGVDINSGFEIEPALKNIEDIKEFKQNL